MAKNTTKSARSGKSPYIIEKDIPLTGWTNFDLTSPAYLTMTTMKPKDSFPFDEKERSLIYNTSKYLQRNNEMHFAIRQERDKETKMPVVGKLRVWRLEQSISRKYKKKKIEKS